MDERRRYREDKEKQEAASRTIIMTSFASTERIYLSNRDLMNPYGSVIRMSHSHLLNPNNRAITTTTTAKKQVSRIIEFTSFASSERIYLSSRDLLDNPDRSNNNLSVRGEGNDTLERLLRQHNIQQNQHRHRTHTFSTSRRPDIVDGFATLPPLPRHNIVDGYASLPHPRSNSDGSGTTSQSKSKLTSSTEGVFNDIKINGTGFCPRTRRPLSLQLAPSHSSSLYENHHLPMPRKLNSIRKEVIQEEEEPVTTPERNRSATLCCDHDAVADAPCEQHPDSPTLTRFNDIDSNKTSRSSSRRSSTKRTRSTNSFSSTHSAYSQSSGRSRGFWGRLMGSAFPKHERMTIDSDFGHGVPRRADNNEIYIIEERLAVV